MSKLIPNSFQHPNILVDKLDYYLTAEETKILNKAVREILGWQKRIDSRAAPISLSIFVEGKFAENGERLCYGTGLSVNAVRNALEALNECRVLIKIGAPGQDGQLYWLQDDDNQVDWEWLEKRKAEWGAVNAKRTQKATAKSLQNRGNVGRYPLSSDDTLKVTSDDNKESHGKPIETQHAPNGAAVSLDDVFEPKLDPPLPNGRQSLIKLSEQAVAEFLLLKAGRTANDEQDQRLLRANWQPRAEDIRQALLAFLDNSRLPLPVKKGDRVFWENELKEHIDTYGLGLLPIFYKKAIEEMRDKPIAEGRARDVISIKSPKSITYKLGELYARYQSKQQPGYRLEDDPNVLAFRRPQ